MTARSGAAEAPPVKTVLTAPPDADASVVGLALAGRRWRLLRVYRVTFQVLLSYGWLKVAGLVRSRRWVERQMPRRHRLNARRVRDVILDVQGLFVKVGQLISILSNFLPADFRSELEGLQDRVTPRPWGEIRARLAAELGGEPDELFDAFERQPIASASLAQVHRARMADGRSVAVKVQHLDIEETARLDLATIGRIVRWVQPIVGLEGLERVHAEVREMIADELDFSREAEHLREIAENFEDDPEVSCPRVVGERSTRRVLTTHFVDGVKITDVAALEELGIDRRELAERVLGAYCRMIFEHGLYHADPHPGNILVGADGGIVFLDFGAVARLSPGMKEGIPQFVEGVLRRDQERLLQALRRMGFVQRAGSGEVAEQVIDYFYGRFLEGIELDSWSLEEVRVDARMKLEMMADLSRLDVTLHQLTATFQVPKEWILLQRTLLLLMGVCTHLEPRLRPMAVVLPYLEEFVLGRDRDWVALASTVVKDLAMTAVTLPVDLSRLVEQARRGELEVDVRGLAAAGDRLYALGHQLIYALFTVAGVFLAYLAHGRGDEVVATAAAGVAGFFFLCMGGSFWRARRRLRS